MWETIITGSTILMLTGFILRGIGKKFDSKADRESCETHVKSIENRLDKQEVVDEKILETLDEHGQLLSRIDERTIKTVNDSGVFTKLLKELQKEKTENGL